MHLARLLSDHSKLRSLGADLVAIVSSAEPCDFRELARRRWDLARTVHLHLCFEERELFCRLEADPRPQARAAGVKGKRSVEQLHSLYKGHVERWNANGVTSRWPEFQAAVRVMVRRMIAAIDHEEVELFPFLAGGMATGRGRRPGTRNWASVGVALQPLISATAKAALPRQTGLAKQLPVSSA